jgi:hypothetical protein
MSAWSHHDTNVTCWQGREEEQDYRIDEISNKIMNSIAGVMVAIGLCAWSAVDHGFEHWWGKTKGY